MTIGTDIESGTRLAACINPVAGRNASTRAVCNRRLVMGVAARRLQAFTKANALVGGAHHINVALFYCVDETKFEGVNFEFSGHFIHDQLKGQSHLRHARSAVGMDFWFVGINRTARRAGIAKFVTGCRHKGRNACRVTVIGSGVHEAIDIGCDESTVFGSSELNSGFGAGCWASCTEYIATIHHHFYRPPRLFSQ